MNSLLLTPPFSGRTPAPTAKHHRALTLGALLAFSCLVPFSALLAQNPVPDGTGTVSCDVLIPTMPTNPDNPFEYTTENVTYEVELYGSTVVGRWGPGKDVHYEARYFMNSLPMSNFTEYFYAMMDPNDPDTYEELYSETGKWDVRVNLKKNSWTLRGGSYAAIDREFEVSPGEWEWLEQYAACSWRMSGYIPTD